MSAEAQDRIAHARAACLGGQDRFNLKDQSKASADFRSVFVPNNRLSLNNITV
jgi:hypothetical protein